MNEANFEEDYRRVVDRVGPTRFLPGSTVEIIRASAGRQPPRHVVFDFDGTLSLIREGWPEVMVGLMVEVLQATGTEETPESLQNLAMDFIMQLAGKQTVYQMIRLAEEVRQRGGSPEDPLAYKHAYHERLMARIEGRREALRGGSVAAADMLVPHALDLLQRCSAAAWPCISPAAPTSNT